MSKTKRIPLIPVDPKEVNNLIINGQDYWQWVDSIPVPVCMYCDEIMYERQYIETGRAMSYHCPTCNEFALYRR